MESIVENIKYIAIRAGRNPFIKKLMKPFYYSFLKMNKTINSYRFHKKALGVIRCFDQIMENNNKEYVLIFGSLLGAVREKGFIKHDLDIDVAMWAADWTVDLKEILSEAGFELEHTFLVDEGLSGREETYVKDGVGIDIFYFYPPIDQYPYCCDFLRYNDSPTFSSCMKKHGGLIARRVELPISKKRVKVPFENIELFIPENANEILLFRYGPDYMIPNPQWGISSFNNHITVWEEKKGIYIK